VRKNKRTIKALFSELEKTGIAANACNKAGVARSTYYRWYNDDIEFRMGADQATEIGRANMVDFAESKLVQNVNDGVQRAVEFYLKHNDSRYRNLYGRELQEFKDLFEKKNRSDFAALDLIPRVILDALPEETMIELFDLWNVNPNYLEEKDEKLEKELGRILAMKYIASIMERNKK